MITAKASSNADATLDQLYASWRRLGVNFTGVSAAAAVDLERLVLATAHVAGTDERLTICAVSWLATLHLKRWTESDGFRHFLGNFGKHLPLRKPSAFADRDMVHLVLSRSDGITGRATRLLSRAAAEAMIDGTEFITIERIEQLSQRESMAA